MQKLLDSKVALVTGGTAGIGRAIAEKFVEQGADVVIFGTNLQRATEAVEQMKVLKCRETQRISFQLVNVGNFSEVSSAIESVLSTFGKIDILVNNAGITRDGLLMRMSEQDWDQVLEVNLKSVYNTCKVIARPMMKARSGSIINISSVIGLTGNAGQVNYAASKAGMIGFTKSLAKELSSRGIRANCVAPGYIDTKMTEVLPEQIKEGILTKIPLGRMGHPQDVASAVLFLASDMSSYITGQVLAVDGGMVM